MKHSRFVITAAALATAISCAFGAAPALASTGQASTAAAPVHVDSAAGAVYYTCVEPNGSLLTVLYGQKVRTQCRGANAIQMHYETGQFIRTIKLTPAGTPGKKYTARPGACIAAVVSGVVLVVQPELTVGWYISSAVTAYGLTDCISQ